MTNVQHDALGADATREQITETIAVAVMIDGGPALVYGAEALDALNRPETP
jgi:alkylhydroperoxidase/carboxymuconolactone decarboxylase family protein YurZ